ncbi:MAG TPA: PEP-CTERM sorting domain-containing protein [Armatimonadota bacterium]|nr:PEP-CTERM sorting domain-containing protein [Armatimonadota bacterium]
MKKTLFLLIAVLLLSLASAATADVPTGTYWKWSQPIDKIDGEFYQGMPVYNGWDQPSWNRNDPPVGPPQVADDWPCRDNRPVTDIHWWGSYVNYLEQEPPVSPRAFWFGMYTDVPASADEHSHPGNLIWDYVTPAINGYQEVFVGYDKDPRDGLIKDSTFQYNVMLPETEWFRQDPSIDGIYWLSIVALYDTVPSYPWGWKTRPHYYMDDAVKLNAAGGWDRVGFTDTTGNFQSWDTAFELSTVPEPSSLLALGMGLVGLTGLIRRRR